MIIELLAPDTIQQKLEERLQLLKQTQRKLKRKHAGCQKAVLESHKKQNILSTMLHQKLTIQELIFQKAK